MNILCIDTSGEVLSLGLKNGEAFLENIRDYGLRHAETLAPLIQSLMGEMNLSPKALDLVVCTRGPGSFTGLRIGLATAKGISEGVGCPLVSIPTLDALAEPWRSLKGVVIPVVNARKQRFYARLFRGGRALTEAMDITPGDLADLIPPGDEVFIAGPGGEDLKGRWIEALPREGIIFLDAPGAAASRGLLRLGRKRLEEVGPDTPEIGPIYLRPSEAEIKKTKGAR